MGLKAENTTWQAQIALLESALAELGANPALGLSTSVTGGFGNIAEGAHSTVGGSLDLHARGDYDWVAGKLRDED